MGSALGAGFRLLACVVRRWVKGQGDRMTDWKKMASALDPVIPEADAEKVVPVLNALEAAWRPLQASIPAGTDLWTGPEDIA